MATHFPAPLGRDPLTPAQVCDLETDVRRSLSSRRGPYSCRLCGKNTVLTRRVVDGLCFECWRAPDDTPEALHAIDRLRALKALREEGL